MKKILIALQSEIIANRLQQQFSGQHCVLVCHNGLDAAEILQEQNPHVLLLDLRLPGIDGITLLQAAKDSGMDTQVIVMTDYLSNHILNALEQLEVASVLPMDSTVAAVTVKILELLQQEQPSLQVQRTLAMLGFKLNTVSYRITEQAVLCYMENSRQQITAELYPRVAKLCGGTPSQVEKALRSGVETAWKNGDKRLWRLYFGNGRNGKPLKPSNGDFLARIVLCLTRGCGERKKA